MDTIKKLYQLADTIYSNTELDEAQLTEHCNNIIHEVVVEISKSIYERIMAEELIDSMGGAVGDLIDDIDAEHEGVEAAEDELEDEVDDLEDIEGVEAVVDFDDTDEEQSELEDAAIRIEDKLDQLIAEFEASLNGDAEEEVEVEDEVADVEFDVEDEVEDVEELNEEEDEDIIDIDSLFVDDEEEEEVDLLESAKTIKLPKVSNVDPAANKKSPIAANAGKNAPKSKAAPIKASTAVEKGRTAPAVKQPSKVGNQAGSKNYKLEKAPTPKTKPAAGEKSKSPVAKK